MTETAQSSECWNTLGVHGDSSCPELAQHVHCRNCPVYASAALSFLRRDLPQDHLANRTEHLARRPEAKTRGTHSAIIFRIAEEWLALSMLVLDEIAEPRPIHSLPHRRGGTVLGLVNVRGELLVCVSLARLLGLESAMGPKHANERTARPQLLVANSGGQRAVFPVDDMGGIYRYDPHELRALPATVTKGTSPFTKALLSWNGRAVGFLDEQRVFPAVKSKCRMIPKDLSELSMLDLFRMEAESQTQTLTSGLLALERDPDKADHLEACMRAAHSLKGAARLVDIDAGVALAHAMEDCFVAAQTGRIHLAQKQIDLLLEGVDLLLGLTRRPDVVEGATEGAQRPEVDAFIQRLGASIAGIEAPAADAPIAEAPAPPPPQRPQTPPSRDAETIATAAPSIPDPADRVFRVSADNLNRLLGLAGESLVESRWLKPFGQSLLRLKRLHHHCSQSLEMLRDALPPGVQDERARMAMSDARSQLAACQQFLLEQLAELDISERRSTNLTHRLYDSVLACRMRPFSDGIQAFPRMVRDLGRTLDKSVRLDIVGGTTDVDRDILEQLEAPLGHLLRNAIDHGLEPPAERRAAGKPEQGVLTLEARHNAGALQITVADDGRGIDLVKLRATVIKRQLTDAETAQRLSETELLEFLFLPGFTMKERVTEISGRGVGLDVVQDMIRRVRGVVRVFSQFGVGTRFQLQVPLTLSVVRALVAEIAGEPYAIPLAYIARAVKIAARDIEMLENRPHFLFEGRSVGLVNANQILGGEAKPLGSEVPVVLVSDQVHCYGLVVDRFLGRHDLVVQPLDSRLGKIKDISAAALMDDGAPVLIVDVEDMIRSMEKLASTNRLTRVEKDDSEGEVKRRKRVLVIDDSLTVRELERKLLDRHGYDVDVAVDGMDGWNAVRSGSFDLVVTDVDMPRLDGIELVRLIRRDADLKSLPVMIVSYKDREEDRQRGLEAGADYYLTKGSFHDDGLLRAVVDLIGEAAS